jgi:diaminohydroxyphosphoribosylaminopyrimidine deaminase / 5-amino-6-(5-phosphoribosylamino)uracil reductase
MQDQIKIHEHYMKQALQLARLAAGCTTPNPLVGAVIVKEDQVIGQGYHHLAGTPHAEIHALREAGDEAKGATLYVTLEPCCHSGRTGPCTEAIISAGIAKVVVAITDPNPLVAGQGLRRLREQGIEVIDGICCLEAVRLNETFVKWVTSHMPFVLLKTAMTLDGKIATATKKSKWITGDEARQRVHLLRNQYDGILVGIGTVLADDPLLTVRLPDREGCQPTRIIVDSLARTPLTSQVVVNKQAPTIIAVTEVAPQERIKALKECGVEVMLVSSGVGGIDLRPLFFELAKRPLTSILIEGGAGVNSSALAENLVDKVEWFIAPKIFGGTNAPSPVGGQGVADIAAAYELEEVSTTLFGSDLMVSGYIKSREARDVYRTCGRMW